MRSRGARAEHVPPEGAEGAGALRLRELEAPPRSQIASRAPRGPSAFRARLGGSLGNALENVEVGEVLGPAGRRLRGDQVREGQEMRWRAAVLSLGATLPRASKRRHAVDARQDIDPHGRDAEHDERSRVPKLGLRNVRSGTAQERDQASSRTPRIRRRPIDEDVDVLCRARSSVEADRVRSHDQVPNAMSVE